MSSELQREPGHGRHAGPGRARERRRASRLWPRLTPAPRGSIMKAMPTKSEFESALKDALRAGDETRKRTLRMILSGVKLAEVERRGPLDEAGLLAVLQKEAKTRSEAIADAEKAGRADLVAAAQAELVLLESYLPRPASAEELEALARKAIADAGAASPGDMGRVMKQLMPQIQRRADGKAASDLVRRLLA